MGNTIPHGDRLHECSSTCPEYNEDAQIIDLPQDFKEHFGLEGEYVVREPEPEAQKPNLYVREGDQQLPTPNGNRSCQERFMDRIGETMPARMELGLARYGTLLQPFNGRDFMRDTFEELLDLSVYLEGVAFEREAMLDLIYDLALEGPNADLQSRARVMILSMGKALDLSEDDL